MKSYTWLSLLSALSLTGCMSFKTQFTAAEEPSDGDRARLRVIANALVKAVPNMNCIDLSAPGAGTIFGGIVGSRGYRGRSLDMPSLSVAKDDMGEMYVAAGKPLTLMLMTTPEGISYKGRAYSCSVYGSFTPVKNKNYEAKLVVEPALGVCSIKMVDLDDISTPVPVQAATQCK